MKWVKKTSPYPHLCLNGLEDFSIIFTVKGGERLVELTKPVKLKQVHSSKVIVVNDKVEGLVGDALVTNRRGLYISIKVADCYPVYLIDTETPALGLAHSGWRGTKEKIAVATLECMKEFFNTKVENIWVALGPGVSPEIYEVGENVAKLFDYGVEKRGEKLYLNLPQIIIKDLMEAGVNKERILEPPCFTDREPDMFYSLRRDRKILGEMWALAAIVEPGSRHFNS